MLRPVQTNGFGFENAAGIAKAIPVANCWIAPVTTGWAVV